MAVRIFSKGSRFSTYEPLRNHRATFPEVYQLASKMRLYRGSSARAGPIYIISYARNPSTASSLSPFSVIPLSPSFPALPERLPSANSGGRETRLLYTAIEVKAPPSKVPTFDPRTIPVLTPGSAHAARKNLKFRSRWKIHETRGVAWRSRAHDCFVFSWWAAESILVYVTTKPPARRVTFDNHIDFRPRKPHSRCTRKFTRCCHLRMHRL